MIAAPPPVYPWPIGVGPRYHPTANRPEAALRCGPLGTRYRVHLELFADRRVVVVPAGIGGCDAPLRTTAPTGVVEVSGRRTLGDLFAVWGRRLGRNGFLTFRGRVAAFVNGRRATGDPRRIALRPRDEIVLEVGGYVAPHRDYLFPRGDR
ncbi:MAG TPA: hypothetical protein VHC45_14205 [Gaiellaceae bacterium]|nr:hypothetical protein [Gaiellaceae bacterium]